MNQSPVTLPRHEMGREWSVPRSTSHHALPVAVVCVQKALHNHRYFNGAESAGSKRQRPCTTIAISMVLGLQAATSGKPDSRTSPESSCRPRPSRPPGGQVCRFGTLASDERRAMVRLLRSHLRVRPSRPSACRHATTWAGLSTCSRSRPGRHRAIRHGGSNGPQTSQRA
jgi:hypothetical protein